MPASWARAPGRGQEGRRAVPAGIPEVSWGAGQAGAAGSFRLLSHPRLPPASPGPLVLPASSPDPLTPRLGPTLLQGNPCSLADLVGEGSGLGGIHMESGSEPRTRASPPSAWPRASASLSWATATLPSGQPRATTPSPGTAMSPRPPRTATLPNPPRRLVQLWAQPGGQAGTEGPEGPGPHGTRPAVLPPSPRPRSRSPRQEPR